MRLFRLFRIAWELSRCGGAWHQDCIWSAEDAVRLRTFLTSDAGKKLSAVLRNASLHKNAASVMSGELARVNKAAGFMEAVETLSALAEPEYSETTEEGEHGAFTHLEQLAP
jgi:hypothetical protein